MTNVADGAAAMSTHKPSEKQGLPQATSLRSCELSTKEEAVPQLEGQRGSIGTPKAKLETICEYVFY